jgi:hypothetical protein
MKFEPHGPFTLPRVNGGVDRNMKRSFWKSVEESCPSLPSAVGCYIFAIKAAKGFTPWYVGKTEKLSFGSETWQSGKLLLYGEVIRKYDKGKPVLFLLAKLTGKGKFTKPIKRRNSGSISALEEMLIGTCLQRNKELVNKKLVRYRAMHVPGYLNDQQGKRTKRAKDLASLLKT